MSGQDPKASAAPRHAGEVLRRLREDAGLTRLELGQATKVAPSTIRNIECGRVQANAWTWRKLLRHESLWQLPEAARLAGLPWPPRWPGGAGETGGSGAGPSYRGTGGTGPDESCPKDGSRGRSTDGGDHADAGDKEDSTPGRRSS